MSAKLYPNDLVLIKEDALTYNVKCNFDHDDKVVGLVIYAISPRLNLEDNVVNFDNGALYYVLTSKGCLTVFEFDLEVIDEKEAYCN